MNQFKNYSLDEIEPISNLAAVAAAIGSNDAISEENYDNDDNNSQENISNADLADCFVSNSTNFTSTPYNANSARNIAQNFSVKDTAL